MDTANLQELARKTRFMREAGVALVLSSIVLGLFLFIPLKSESKNTSPITVATSTTPDALASVPIQAQAAIVYDLSTGETLYAKNADAQLPLASLTKLLTVYAALSEFSPKASITVSSQAADAEAPHTFSAGDTLSLSDLARLTLVASLNDGAAAIAEATADRENTSVSNMLASAATGLALSQTYAVNGNGLDENTTVSGGYGSAHDLAILAGALVEKAPDVALATTESSATAENNAGKTYTVKNTNPTVEYAPRLLLSKTGYTDLAGGNLALVFDAGINHPVAVIVLGSTEEARFTDANTLVAATLAHLSGVSSL